jgi:hypothetical protein
MSMIEQAIEADGPSISKITAATGIFTPSEVSCVKELWKAYLDKGEANGYVFLVLRDYG